MHESYIQNYYVRICCIYMPNSVSAKHFGLSSSEKNVFSHEIVDKHCLGTVWPFDRKSLLD